MSDLISQFFSREIESDINPRLLEKNYVFPSNMIHEYLVEIINTDIDEFLIWLDNHFSTCLFSIDDAVQYSNFEDATFRIVKQLLDVGDEGYSYIQIGKFLLDDGTTRTEWAYRKYGENHAKTAAYLGYLFSINRVFYVSAIGYSLSRLTESEQMKLFARLFIRTPLFKTIYYLSKNGNVDLRELLDMLTNQTYIRRRSSIKKLYKKLLVAEPSCIEIVNRIVFS